MLLCKTVNKLMIPICMKRKVTLGDKYNFQLLSKSLSKRLTELCVGSDFPVKYNKICTYELKTTIDSKIFTS